MKKVFTLLIYVFAIIGFVLVAVFTAVHLGWTNSPGIIDQQHDYFQNTSATTTTWSQGEEWAVLREAIGKDTEVINVVSKKVNISPRTLVSILIVEQLRLFNSNREIFKSVFAPLKILGNQSQFSWGVMGIKQETARQIEANLIDKQSSWYPGKEFESFLIYPATTTEAERDSERFARLTNEDDRMYSYLYAALLVKQLEAQWEKSKFPITDKPGIIATLYNIGFKNSNPNADPHVGGAEIEIGDTTYSFGGLAESFYYSSEMIEEFPK
ncbi:MAG: hypothetical protein M3Q80_00530 [bacterium]|nr:hypothetical protein [bacterium]